MCAAGGQSPSLSTENIEKLELHSKQDVGHLVAKVVAGALPGWQAIAHLHHHLRSSSYREKDRSDPRPKVEQTRECNCEHMGVHCSVNEALKIFA